MSYRINGTSIFLTRGDTLNVKVDIYDEYNACNYIPSMDDVITFSLKKDLNNTITLLSKIIPSDTCILRIESEDTKYLDFGDYWYDIQIEFPDGTVTTFITKSKLKLTEEVG